MAAVIDGGPLDWSGRTEADGHKTYVVTYQVRVERASGETGGLFNGPATAMACPDLPQCGDAYEILDSSGNVLDSDPNAYASCEAEARRLRSVKEIGPFEYFAVTKTFSTKAQGRCCDEPRADPLDEPQKVRIETEGFTYEATVDRWGEKVKNSAHEQIHGPQNEWEDGRVKVTITQNVADLELPLLTYLRGKVNEGDMWGLQYRTIRFAGFSAEPKFGGPGCQGYWTRTLTFDVRFEGQDRQVPDEGTMALNGHWGVNQGTGLSVTIVAAGGIITSAAIVSGGSGYPKNSTLSLSVPGGTAGLLGVPTNSSGVCQGSISVLDGGTGYTSGTVSPTGGSGWILDQVSDPCDGTFRAPDPTKPADFSRYLDKAGNPAKVVFDCHKTGQPYDPCRDGSEESLKWWAVVIPQASPVFGGASPIVEAQETNCATAVYAALVMGGYIAGPYDTEGEALAATVEDGVSPVDYDCPGPCVNTLTLEVYQAEDLLQLGVPVDIGDIGSF